MTPKKIALSFIVVVILFIGGSSFFYVDQRVQALVLQFGEPVKLIKEPGLQFKIPLMQNVEYFDKAQKKSRTLLVNFCLIQK